MIRRRVLLAVMIGALAAAIPAAAQEDPAASSPRMVIGAGGGPAAGSAIRLVGTVGNPQPTGAAAGPLRDSEWGFWPVCRRLSVLVNVPPDLLAGNGLRQNFPNPFNPRTTITFSLAAESAVRLVVYDARGRRVRVLLSETRPPGGHSIVWDGRDDLGREKASGMYFCELEAGAFRSVRKMILLK